MNESNPEHANLTELGKGGTQPKRYTGDLSQPQPRTGLSGRITNQ